MAFFQNGSIVHQLLTTVTSGGTLTLTASSRKYQVFTGTTNHTVKLPDATTMKNGMVFTIVNSSTGTITVNYNDNSQATTIETGKSKEFVLFDNSSSNGSFDISTSSSSGGGASQADLNTLRAGQLGSSSLTSGKVYFLPEEIGGDSWITKSPMINSILQAPAHFELSNYLYTAGGYTGSASTAAARYDDTNDFWITRTSMTNARYFVSSFVISGLGYAAGGTVSSDQGLAHLEQYNDGTNAWATKTNLNTAAASSYSFNMGNYGFVAGGTDSGASTLATTQMYDAVNNAWTLRANMTAAQGYSQGAALNEFGYAVTGQDSGPSTVSTVQKFDYIRNSWKNVASAPAGSVRNEAVSVGGFVYSMGGSTATATYEYSDTANLWRNKANIPTGISSSYMSAINGYAFALCTGGATTVQRYKTTNLHVVNLLKRMTAAPTNIYAAVKVKDLITQVPAQIRSDGDSWKNIEANDQASILGLNQELATKFLHYGHFYVTGGDSPSFGTPSAVHELYSEQQNAWVSRTSMNTARGGAPQSANLEGYGIIQGGTDSGPTNVLASTERYDEMSNAWTNRAAATATKGYGIGWNLLGKFYICGGRSGGTGVGNTVATVYQYTNTTDTWATKASLPAGRGETCGYVLNELGYVVSGQDTGSGPNSNNYQYNPSLDSWASKTSAPNSERQCSGFALDGYGYRGSGVAVSSTAVHKYNPTTDSWSSAASLNGSHTNGGGARSGSYGYIYAEQPNAIPEQYNGQANTWTVKTSFNTTRRSPAHHSNAGAYRHFELRIGLPALLAGFGGEVWSNTGVSTTRLGGVFALKDLVWGLSTGTGDASTEKYSHVTNTFMRGPSYNTARTNIAGFSLYGFGYGAAGYNGSALSTSEKLNDETNVWTSIANMNNARQDVGMGTPLNGFGYVVGSSNTNVCEQYNPQTNAWTNKASFTNPGTAGSASEGMWTSDGYVFTTGSDNITSLTQRYSDVDNAWTTVASLITARLCGTFAFKGVGYAAGNSSGPSASVEKYNFKGNFWYVAPSMVHAGYSHGGAAADYALMLSPAGSNPANKLTSSLKDLVAEVLLSVD